MQSNRTRATRYTKVRRQWRVQVWHPIEERFVSACSVLGMPGTLFATKGEAKKIGEAGESILARRADGNVTVSIALDRWLARPLDKESSRVTSEDRTKVFRARHGEKLLAEITDDVAAHYGAGCPSHHVEGLRSFFNWCVRSKLMIDNPFRTSVVASRKRKGNKEVNPPHEDIVARIVKAGVAISPDFGAWLEFGAWVGTRPGETDTIRWTDFSRDLSTVRIERQWNEKAGAITLPKNGMTREVGVPDHVAETLRTLPRYDRRLTDEYVFLNTHGSHFKPTSRAYYWKGVRSAVPALLERKDWTTYMVTRHFAGWYMVNRLERPSEDVAFQLGHTDDGDLVRKLYGHRDRTAALRSIRDAHRARRRDDDEGEAVAA